MKISGPWRGSFSIESSAGNPKVRELGSCHSRVSWTLQTGSHTDCLPSVGFFLKTKEQSQGEGFARLFATWSFSGQILF